MIWIANVVMSFSCILFLSSFTLYFMFNIVYSCSLIWFLFFILQYKHRQNVSKLLLYHHHYWCDRYIHFIVSCYQCFDCFLDNKYYFCMMTSLWTLNWKPCSKGNLIRYSYNLTRLDETHWCVLLDRIITPIDGLHCCFAFYVYCICKSRNIHRGRSRMIGICEGNQTVLFRWMDPSEL